MPIIISHLQKILDYLADFLLPKDQKVKRLEKLGPDGLFEKIPRAENFDFEKNNNHGNPVLNLKAIFNYRNALCRQAIWEIKFRGNKKLIHDFSLLLYEFILDELSDLETFGNFRNIILIPVPSSKARLRERGFNQCLLICQELIKFDAARKTFTLKQNLLIKKEETAHQARTKNRKQRFKNLKGSFDVNLNSFTTSPAIRIATSPRLRRGGDPSSVSPLLSQGEGLGVRLADFSFIIIDDVITTSATMQEAFRALRLAGARKIFGFALAH